MIHPRRLATARAELTLIVILLTFLLACNGGASTSAETATEPAPTGAQTASSFAGTTVTAVGLTFDLPNDWTAETPSSQMRAAQAAIPGSGGAGQMTMFFFGAGGGGGVEANLARWTGQVVPNEGETPRRETFNQGDLNVTSIEIGGTLKASQIGSFPTTDMPDYRLFAAVIEGQGGPWFFRAVGPEETMQEQRANYTGMLRSVRVE